MRRLLLALQPRAFDSRMGIARAASAVYGTCEPAVQRLVSAKIDDILDDLILEAVALWQSSGLVRFDDREVNCSVQVFRHINIARRRRASFRILQPRLEHLLLTDEILTGQQSADTARRPDMHVSIGDRTNRAIECKLLSDTGPLARAYVREGMNRFVSGVYGTTDRRGRMIGFVVQGEHHDCVKRVNHQVVDFLDEGHQLSGPPATSNDVTRYESTHARVGLEEIGLTHFLVPL